MLEPITSGIVVVGRWVVRDCLVARASLNAREPIRDARPVFPEAGESEPVETLDVGRDFRICQSVCVGGKPRGLSKLYFHLGHGLLKHLDVIPKDRGLDAFLAYRALTLAPRRLRHFHQPLHEPSSGLFLELLPK